MFILKCKVLHGAGRRGPSEEETDCILMAAADLTLHSATCLLDDHGQVKSLATFPHL